MNTGGGKSPRVISECPRSGENNMLVMVDPQHELNININIKILILKV